MALFEFPCHWIVAPTTHHVMLVNASADFPQGFKWVRVNPWCFQNGYGSGLWHTAANRIPVPRCHGYARVNYVVMVSIILICFQLNLIIFEGAALKTINQMNDRSLKLRQTCRSLLTWHSFSFLSSKVSVFFVFCKLTMLFSLGITTAQCKCKHKQGK